MAAKPQASMKELLGELSTGLRTQAVRPNILGYKAHAKQAMFHSKESRGRLYIGGNRSGKTTGGVTEDIMWLTGRHPYKVISPGPIRGRVVCVDFLNGVDKIVLPEFARWLPPSDLINGSWTDSYSKGARTLTLANGSFVEFMSYDQDLDKFAGTSRHFTHYDEEPPQDIFTECSMRLIDTGGSWWITMTPVEGMTWIYDTIYLPGKNDPTGMFGVVEVDMDENPYLATSEIELLTSHLTKDEIISRKKGKFVQIGGLVFKGFDPEVHVIEPMIPPTSWEWYASCDHGFNNPTAWLWHAVSPDGEVITFSEHYESERTIDYHSAVVHSRNAGFGRVPDLYVCDPALAQRQAVTGTSIHTEYVNNGIPLIFGANDVATGINRMNTYLQMVTGSDKPRWSITRNCQNLIHEMQRLRWKTFASKRMANDHNKYDLIHKKDDHACDSARYFFSCLPDLAPQVLAPKAESLMLPSAPVGIDAFYAKKDPFLGVPQKKTEWTVQGTIDTLGGEW